MKISRRQTLPFVAAMIMLVSAFTFAPASGETGFSVNASGFYNHYSFASYNGTATYTLNMENTGDSDINDVVITSEFPHTSWLPDNVTFSDGSSEEIGFFAIETFAAGTTQQLTASVTVGYGVQLDYPEVPVVFNADSGSSTIGSTDVVVVVTNWIAYESNYPDTPDAEVFSVGENNTYQLTVDNIAVVKNSDNTTSPMAIRDSIQVQYSGISGWSVTSDDESWHPFYGGQLAGMDAGASITWDVKVELTGTVKAGPDVINFQASSTDPDDPMGGMPYYQPYGLSVIPVSAAEAYGVDVSGSGMRHADVSEGSSLQDWQVGIHNIGNTEDTFALTWDVTNVPMGWTLSALPDTSGEIGWEGSYNFDVALTIPADALAGSSASFTMVADSSNSDENATQTFEAVVDQHYGVSLAVDSTSMEASPGSTVDFNFALSNAGNGEDTFGISIDGAAYWSPVTSVSNLTVSAVSDGQFLASVTIPEDRNAGAESGDIVVTVSSSNGETTANVTISAVASQVFDISMDHSSGSDGKVTIIQGTTKQVFMNVTNIGNGFDNLTLELIDEPSWASLDADYLLLGPDGNFRVAITLDPDTAALSGKEYVFNLEATSQDGESVWSSPYITAEIEVKETEVPEVVEEVVEDEDDSPGFGILASLLAFTFVVLNRRKD